MVLPVLLVAFLMAMAIVYLYLRRQPTRATLWRTALLIGCAVGVVRAALASAGWYIVEHTGGPLQVPAFALAMLAWPEAAILDERRTTPVPPEFYTSLTLLLIISTVMLVGLVAVIVELTRSRVRVT